LLQNAKTPAVNAGVFFWLLSVFKTKKAEASPPSWFPLNIDFISTYLTSSLRRLVVIASYLPPTKLRGQPFGTVAHILFCWD